MTAIFGSAPNFRDFGGWDTGDGRRVARGRLFRSGQLARLTDADGADIAALGLACVVDLRTRDERALQPARWAAVPPRLIESDKSSLADEMARALEGADTVAAARHGFGTFYARIPELYAAEFARLFAALAEGAVPLLVNCTAGKDRTGTACALILSALGVPRDLVIRDYAETNARLPALKALREAAPMAGAAQEVVDARQPSAAVREALWQADPVHLGVMLDGVAARHGSVVGYVTDRLALGRDGIRAMRAALLEPR